LRTEWSLTDDVVTQKRQGHDPNIFGAIISTTAANTDLDTMENL